MKLTYYFSVILSLMTPSFAVQSTEEQSLRPFIPVVAKFVRTMEQHGEERSKTIQSIRETYARSSEGSEYRKNEVVDEETGTVVLFNETISSVQDATDYLIDYVNRTVIMRDRRSVGSRTERQTEEERDPETQTIVLGRMCTWVPVTGAAAGEMCFDNETGVPLLATLREESAEGELIKTLRAVEFVSGVEADPSLFRFRTSSKADFAFVDTRRH